MTMRVSCKGLTDHDLILSRRLKTPRDKDGNLLTKKSTQLGTTEQLVSALREAIFARSPVTSQGWRRAFVEFRKKSGRQRSTGVWWQESSQESGVSLDEFAKASHSYSMRWDEPTTRRVFSAIDVDGDGQVSGDEFMRFINAGMGVGRLDTRANEAPSPLPQRRSTRDTRIKPMSGPATLDARTTSKEAAELLVRKLLAALPTADAQVSGAKCWKMWRTLCSAPPAGSNGLSVDQFTVGIKQFGFQYASRETYRRVFEEFAPGPDGLVHLDGFTSRLLGAADNGGLKMARKLNERPDITQVPTLTPAELVKQLREARGVDAHGVAYPAGLQLSRGEPLRQELLECAPVAPTGRMDKPEPLMPAGSKWSFGSIPPPRSQLELERKFSQGLI